MTELLGLTCGSDPRLHDDPNVGVRGHRFFLLNAERAEQEVQAEIGKAAKEKAKGARKAGKWSEGADPQRELF